MKKLTLMLMSMLLLGACGSIEVKESPGDEERFSRRPAAEEKMVYSEVNLEKGVDPVYRGRFVPEYDYKPDTETSDMMIERLNK